MSLNINIVEIDLSDPIHQQAVAELVIAFADDPAYGGGKQQWQEIAPVIDGLRNHPTTLIYLAYEGDTPIGIAVCFMGFSTFAARQWITVVIFRLLFSTVTSRSLIKVALHYGVYQMGEVYALSCVTIGISSGRSFKP